MRNGCVELVLKFLVAEWLRNGWSGVDLEVVGDLVVEESMG